MKIKIKKTRFLTWILLIVVLNTTILTVFLMQRTDTRLFDFSTNNTIEQLASEAINTCANAPYKPSCYDKEIPKFMNRVRMEDIFRVAKSVKSQDPSYAYCHVLGHNTSSIEVKKDPEKWQEVITRCPSGSCANGCLHGAMQERFRAESLSDATIKSILPELAQVCEKRDHWSPTKLEQGACYHGLGHLNMYITSADIEKSLNICNAIAVKKDGKDFKRQCYDGAFMQIFQALEPEDIALVKEIKPSKNTVEAFCSRFPPEQKLSCWTESWPLSLDQIMTSDGLLSYCSGLESDLQDRCYYSLFNILSVQLHFNQEKMASFCSEFQKEVKDTCFATFATRMIEIDTSNTKEALNMCKSAEKFSSSDRCYDELAHFASIALQPNSKELNTLCESLPTQWMDKCKNPTSY